MSTMNQRDRGPREPNGEAMKTSKLLVVVIVLQSLALLSMWAGQPSAGTARADTQLPNPGERQIQMIDELKAINGKLEKLNSMLQSGELRVKTDSKDKK